PKLCAYYAHALDIIDTTYNASYMAYWISHYHSFCPGQDFSGILPYIEQHSHFVRTNLAKFATNSFGFKGTNFFSTGSDFMTVTGSAPVQVQSILINGHA